MARIQRDTVSYFPHDSNACSSDTVTVLQSRFGNNGYAFWFKLLEKLACTDGHFLDCNNPVKWQLLVAYFGVNEITTVEIIDCLVEMQAIDKELWESRLIWCQKLVDNIADVYKNRRRELPPKPLNTNHNRITTVETLLTTIVSVPPPKKNKTTEQATLIRARSSFPPLKSKVKESKVKESKVKESIKESKVKESKVNKGTNNLQEYIENELRNEFPEININEELKRFYLYWSEGKRKLQRPKTAFRNWLLNARKYRQEKTSGTDKKGPKKPKDAGFRINPKD